MDDRPKEKAGFPPWAWVLAHVVAWGLLLVNLLLLVPRFQRPLIDIRAKLPVLTRMILQASAFLIQHAYVLPVAAAVLLAVDAWVLSRWGPRGRGPAALWAVLMLLLPLLGSVCVWLTVWLPFTHLLEGLSR